MLDKFKETAITWDKANRKIYESLRASAGDNKGRKLSVQLVNDGVIEDLSGASLSLFWETRDKTNKGLDAFTAVDATKGEFEIYYTTGMLSNEGTLNANLVLVDTSGRVVSEPFTITVFKGIDDDAIQSSDSFTALTEALAQVSTINNKADRAELLALESTFEQNKLSVEQQLQHIAYNMSALVGDGVTNDRPALQNLISEAKNNKVKKIIIPKSTYRIDGILLIDRDDIEIDFSGSTLLSYAQSTGNAKGETGIISVIGRFIETDITPISYYRSLYEYQGTHTPPANSPALLTFEKHTKDIGKLTTDNNDYFSIGDEIMIVGWTKANTDGYTVTGFNPVLRTVATILDKDATHLYIDYASPFNYPAFVTTDKQKSVVNKIETVKNVKIKNVIIKDMVKFATKGAPTREEFNASLSPISSYLTDNFYGENIAVYDHKFPGLYNTFSINTKVKNMHASDPQMWDGGQGYTIQNLSSRRIDLDNITGDYCRHIVDVSATSHVTIKNSKGIRTRQSDIDLHGYNEHDIHIESCQGGLTLTNNILDMPGIISGVTVDKSDLKVNYAVVSGEVLAGYIDNLVITNSSISFTSALPALNLDVVNSSIEWIFHTSHKSPNKKGQTLNTKAKYDNCKITLGLASSNYVNIGLYEYESVTFRDTEIKFGFDPATFISEPVFRVFNVGRLTFDNTKTENLFFEYVINSTGPATSFINVNKSDFRYYGLALPKFFRFGTMNKVKCYVNVADTHVFSDLETGFVDLFNSANTNKTDAEINMKLHDNYFIGNTPESLAFTFPFNTAEFVRYIDDYNNTLKNIRAGSRFTDGANRIIT